ncbi:hypothetical protein ACSBR1_037555 [Camellia fascicularis]
MEGGDNILRVSSARLSSSNIWRNSGGENLLERLVKIAEDDNEKFLLKLKKRIDRVRIDLPTIEVRFEHLNVNAEAYVGGRALPTILNFSINLFEGFLNYLHVLPSRKKPLSILHDVSGIIKPGRMTLLLGPPSSGKTSLLLALGGKLDSDLKVSGKVTYNGYEMNEFVPQRTSAYISQHDLHIGELTVRETLSFSARCQGVGARYDMLIELARREKESNIKLDPDLDIYMKAVSLEGQRASVVTDYVLQILGLEVCADTVVGNEMKKRVTTGEMLVGPARALFMDEISTGLDSSTPYQIVNSIKQSIHILQGTAVISLLQPAPETYDLFDDIILLSDGQIVYEGPRENVLEFFEYMGFKCPERKGVADFLQELIIMAFITMTIFLRTEMPKKTTADGTVFMGALFFGIMMVMFNGFAELAMTILKLPTFYKQRDLLFFLAWAYSLPTWILKIPITFVEVGIWVFTTYYVIGFDPNVRRLFKMYLLLLFTNQMASGMFRLIGALGRNMIVANTFGSFALLGVLVLGGFIMSRGSYKFNRIIRRNSLEVSWDIPRRILVLDWSRSFNWIYFFVQFPFHFGSRLSQPGQYDTAFGKPQAILTEETMAERNPCKTGEIELSSRGKRLSERRDEVQRSASSTSVTSRVDSISEVSQNKKRGMVLPFEPLSITFDDIRYAVDMPQEMKGQGIPEDRLELLKGVSCVFRAGVLTALMGVSGAGKTTLMDVLAGRKTGGYIEGRITISGYPKKQETCARVAGYCEQTDIHSPYVTVYESLQYSAWLRLPLDVDSASKKMFVNEVMELVELTPLKEALVGLLGVNGLSTEQRKRLTIAVELVANPSIIFIDEPTSGLDARAAAIVMRTVRNTVDTGRTVMCTIHQPSIDIFDAFDELFLLKRGGEEIYVGPLGRHSTHLIEYFEGINGISKIKAGYNPATWMLEVTSAAQEAALRVNFAEVYKNSNLYRRNKDLIKDLSKPPLGSKDIYFPTQYSQALFIQCMACLWKQHLSYWRNPSYSAVRFLFTTCIALLTFPKLIFVFWNCRETQQDIFNAMGSMYAAVLFLGIQNAGSVQPIVAIERTVFYRERATGMYSALPYAFGQVVIQLPYIFVQTLIYGVIVYAMIGFEWTVAKFLWYLFFMYFTLLYFTFYGMMTVAVTPNHNIASIVSSAFYALWNLFSGFIIPKTRIPVWWRWYYYICPVAWTLYGLVASQFGDIQGTLDTGETVEEFVRNYFDFKHDFVGYVAIIIAGIAILFGFIFAYSIRVFNFQKR